MWEQVDWPQQLAQSWRAVRHRSCPNSQPLFRRLKSRHLGIFCNFIQLFQVWQVKVRKLSTARFLFRHSSFVFVNAGDALDEWWLYRLVYVYVYIGDDRISER